ncbi:hypothetical protein EV182_006805 [Spiromyces aspiralis]|uniref:Uncharacterized protein n=1 Tax=Spiromyces aspiralis TaxID=68401 RepID=A0ACC1HAI3_9FUNG|nr:hypothetical protein EV182_006805 [Spiromyces aspiralis]
MERDNFVLDAILTVIDCVNFRGYEDTSYTTKMQAKYTDLILLNKWELVSERDLDTVIDHVNELNADTPHVKVSKGEGVAPDLVFGIDTKLFELKHGQVDIEGESEGNDHHHQDEVDLISIKKHRESVDAPEIAGVTFYEADEFIKFLDQLSPSDVYRVKGLVRIRGLSAEVETSGGLGQELIAHPKAAPGPDQLSDTPLLYILNHAFGRYTFTPILHHERHGEEEDLSKVVLRATVIGIDLRLQVQRVKQGLSLEDTHISTHWANRK